MRAEVEWAAVQTDLSVDEVSAIAVSAARRGVFTIDAYLLALGALLEGEAIVDADALRALSERLVADSLQGETIEASVYSILSNGTEVPG